MTSRKYWFRFLTFRGSAILVFIALICFKFLSELLRALISLHPHKHLVISAIWYLVLVLGCGVSLFVVRQPLLLSAQ